MVGQQTLRTSPEPKAGDIVLPGSMTPIYPVGTADRIEAEFDVLGERVGAFRIGAIHLHGSQAISRARENNRPHRPRLPCIGRNACKLPHSYAVDKRAEDVGAVGNTPWRSVNNA